jgi:signal transduction histidine kinase
VQKTVAKSISLDYTRISADDLIAQAVSNVRMVAESEGITLLIEMALNLPHFYGDEDKLVRTLVNLLGNAIKFTPSGGIITVGTRMSDDRKCLLFSVIDIGSGALPPSLKHIFEKHEELQNESRGNSLSTGLGLSFCKMAIEAHGGVIRVTCEPGEGCTFAFTIPLTREGYR